MAAKKTAAAKPAEQKVGSTWDVPSGSVVGRPDGMVVSVGHGGHVLDVPGTFTCGDESVTAK
jgi:hypothetical protein